MKISTFTDYYHTLHESGYFKPYDPYFDMFVCFHPGFGHPGSAPEWEKTLPLLLETKMPILATGYTEEDLSRDVKWIHDKCAGEFDVLMEPQENRFKSLRWDINEYVCLDCDRIGNGGANEDIVMTRVISARGTGDCGCSAGRGMRRSRRRRGLLRLELRRN